MAYSIRGDYGNRPEHFSYKAGEYAVNVSFWARVGFGSALSSRGGVLYMYPPSTIHQEGLLWNIVDMIVQS